MTGEVSYAAPRAVAPAGGARAGPVLVGVVAVAGLGAADGGYFPSSWGWALLAALAALAWLVSLGRVAVPSRLEAAFLVALGLLAAWFALSGLWGETARSVDETARAVLYVAVAACAICVTRRAAAVSLVAGVLAGASAIALYALATRLFPDRIGTFDSIAGYRLAAPIGYWNALGLLCAIALLAALSCAVASTSAGRSALASAPAPVLATTLYFTFSRGSWLALAIGLVVALALTPARVRVTAAALAIGIPSAIAIVVGSRSDALTHTQTAVAAAAHDGHRLAVIVAALVVVAALLGAAASRLTPPVRAERAYGLALAAAVVVAIVVVLVQFGSPASIARRAWHSFAGAPPRAQVDLRRRLSSFSGNGRVDLWREAVKEFDAHPVQGGGAGSYEAYWLRHRTRAMKVRDAHSLYLETMAELGIVGLVLLVAALALPLVAAVRARRVPGVAAAAGAYVAYLVHAGVDWDWEIASLTLAGLLAGIAVLVAARSEDRADAPATTERAAILGATIVLAALAFVFLVGNMFLSRADNAASDGRWAAATRDADRASTWLPWSTDAIRERGEAALAEGRLGAARASFHEAIANDRGDWNLWLDLARASVGGAQRDALARAARLNPLSPEIAELRRELGKTGGISIGVGK